MSFLLTATAESLAQPEQSYVTRVDPSLTCLKNADRIDEIKCLLEVVQRKELFTTQPIARTLRRDWNIVSAKMYVFSLKTDYRALIEEDLAELHHQVEALYLLANIGIFSDVDTSWLTELSFEIKIVSPLCSSWLRALKIWDACTARLLSAEKLGFIDRKQRMTMLRPVAVAYLGFKNTAMKGKGRSAIEMTEEDLLM